LANPPKLSKCKQNKRGLNFSVCFQLGRNSGGAGRRAWWTPSGLGDASWWLKVATLKPRGVQMEDVGMDELRSGAQRIRSKLLTPKSVVGLCYKQQW